MTAVSIPRNRRKALVIAIAVASVANAAAEETRSFSLDALEVSAERNSGARETTEVYVPEATSTALKLDLGYRETPQSVSVITQDQIEDFQLVDINDVLEGTTGVTVESVETDRTYYTSRGFDITNFQYDGVGLPAVYDNIQGDLDTAFYDRVEVLRGANGLMTGSGQPSATVNFIRKRPTADTQASVAATVGSFENRRIVGDVSGSLTEEGDVRGRLVTGYQYRESYLDRYENEKQMFYGVVETDLSDNTLLTVGHTTQTSDTDSPLWGALPLFYSDGSPTDYDRSTSTAADWAYWNNTQHNSFIELQQGLTGGWSLNTTVMRLYNDSDSELFYQYGTPDPVTGLGLRAYPSQYELETEQWVGDVYAEGPFELAGRTHETVLGFNLARSETIDESNFGQGIGTAMPPLEAFNGNYPRPAFTNGVSGSDWTDEEYSLYAAARWSLMDSLTAITGARVSWLDSKGVSYGASKETSYDAITTPYAGLIYDINSQHSVYTSYTEIFTPQTEVNVNRDRLDPIEGTNYEVGLKSEYMQGRLLSTVALFRIKQDNVAEEVGLLPGTSTTYYRAVDGITSEGIELELAGQVTDDVQIYTGYAFVDIDDAEGDRTNTFIPEQTAHLKAVWQVPAVTGLELGTKLRWQSAISQDQGTVASGPNAGQEIKTEQSEYTIIDLMASYDFLDNWNATLNVNNITDEKYIESLKKFGTSAQGFYGAPTNANLKVTWTY